MKASRDIERGLDIADVGDPDESWVCVGALTPDKYDPPETFDLGVLLERDGTLFGRDTFGVRHDPEDPAVLGKMFRLARRAAGYSSPLKLALHWGIGAGTLKNIESGTRRYRPWMGQLLWVTIRRVRGCP